MPTRRAALMSALAAAAIGRRLAEAQTETAPTILRLERTTIEVNGKAGLGLSNPPAQWKFRHHHRGRRPVPGARRERDRAAEPGSLARPRPALAAGWRARHLRAADPGRGTADYDFPLAFGGTFWMHSHQGFQEQLLLSAPLIIRDQRDRPGQQEIVLMLQDFSFTPPAEIFANLKRGSSMPGMGSGTAAMAGMAPTGQAGAPDLNDVAYDAFLANRRTLADPELVKVEPGGQVLLRVINASSMSSYHFDLGRLEGRLIAVDGTLVEPIAGGNFQSTSPSGSTSC